MWTVRLPYWDSKYMTLTATYYFTVAYRSSRNVRVDRFVLRSVRPMYNSSRDMSTAPTNIVMNRDPLPPFSYPH